MSTPNAGSSTAGGTAPATREPAGTGGAYRTTALVLALIVFLGTVVFARYLERGAPK